MTWPIVLAVFGCWLLAALLVGLLMGRIIQNADRRG